MNYIVKSHRHFIQGGKLLYWALAQVRCGAAPLRLETGRWEKRNNIQVPWEERVWLNCFKKGFIETETEEHFLLRCLHPDLKVHRENLLLKACTVLPSFIYLNDTDKLVFLLSNCDIIFFSAKTCSKMLNIRTDVSRTDFIWHFHFNIVYYSLFILYGLS